MTPSGSGPRTWIYWTATAALAAECFAGGVMGALRLQPFTRVVTHLGYPLYFMTILGVCYLAAGVVLLAPRLRLIKEWAYAGLMFVYAGATASHAWVGDGAKTLIGPLTFAGLAAVSWTLRPAQRRESGRDRRS
jgi:hypothetical protein